MPPPEVPEPFQLKVKAWTAVVTAATLAGLLLFDWDKATAGQETVFSGIRPAIKGALNRVYGIQPAQEQQEQRVQGEQQGSSGSSQQR